jgi:hypothetical protein
MGIFYERLSRIVRQSGGAYSSSQHNKNTVDCVVKLSVLCIQPGFIAISDSYEWSVFNEMPFGGNRTPTEAEIGLSPPTGGQGLRAFDKIQV